MQGLDILQTSTDLAKGATTKKTLSIWPYN